ncbi:DeoR/GlpR family DNA-binding transcription regulator [Clostridium sp. 'White wine YQ']|uniref:DeoR/GlpR family DNA-binding transcription regulator n=1 Tax=Clostridium sp. 'White wine YQ' TaxID=3027474 RepID=UPI002365EF82|nr:DeoR/GlpR family DNA-binding transcription regulator [Clostridium sp. 'White wine YQ']MDD7795713.1 DeoR/GlpR family DNA-binding transcription regulator [Clostridium sp. 'White wine YQ']
MNERRNEIFNIISIEPKVSVKKLSNILGVSEVTIRKDLSALEEEGVLKRTHGGAVQMASSSIEKRLSFRQNEKQRIAEEASKLVLPGETILLEAGSTNTVLAKEISKKSGVHIITNSLYITYMLKDTLQVKVTLLGGELQQDSEAMVGPLTTLSLSKIAVDKAFIGMDGFSEKLGFTCGDFFRAEVGKEMCKRAEKTIVLADSSKFDNIGVTPVVELNDVYMVISDKDITKEKLSILKKHNVNTIIV